MRGNYQVRSRERFIGRRSGCCPWFCGNVVACEEIDPVNRVAGNKAGNFVKGCEGIERAKSRFETVRLKPDSVAVGFACLRPARLAEVCSGASAAKGNQSL